MIAKPAYIIIIYLIDYLVQVLNCVQELLQNDARSKNGLAQRTEII